MDPAKATDKIAFLCLYAGISAIILWGGIKLVNLSIEAKFYKDYLMKWEVALKSHATGARVWPTFNGGNHVEYMSQLVQMMKDSGLAPPPSNSRQHYIYLIDKIALLNQAKEVIFLLCFRNKIILYGAGRRTAEKVDRYIDGHADFKYGKFTAHPSKDGKTFIGVWRL